MLFKAYPKAAEVQQKNGWLPLHFALQYNASDDVINMLLTAYQKAAEVQDKGGRLPLNFALCYDTSDDII